MSKNASVMGNFAHVRGKIANVMGKNERRFKDV
jgi:hypothetical protein